MITTTGSRTNHPCFGMTSRQTVGRLHLPVAPRANAKIKFSGKGAVRAVMTPEEAVHWMDQIMDKDEPVGIIGITGPGDPMAVPELTMRTLRMVRDRLPTMPLCLTTLGIGLKAYADELAGIGVSHVTLLVDAVDAEVAERLYAWIRPGTRTMPLPDAAGLLVKEQKRAVVVLKKAGITVKINTTVYPGHNAGHVEEIAATMADMGADIMAIVPFWSSDAPNAPRPDMELLSMVRERAARHIRLMPAWEECGESVVGLVRPDEGSPIQAMPKPTEDRPNVAVVSASGMDVDLHLGHAAKVLIYGPREDGLNCLLEVRDAPEPGSGASRWKALSKLLSDCFVLLTASAGQRPREVLGKSGLTVFITDGEIDGTVDTLYGGGKKKKNGRK